MKCHTCQKELTLIESTPDPDNGFEDTVLECPDVHSQVSMHDGQIVHYRFFVDHQGQRFRIQGSKKHGTTTFLKKTGNRPYKYTEVLQIKRYLNYKPNKEGVLEGQAVFNKLKTLLVFS